MHVFSETENRRFMSTLQELPSHIEYCSGSPAKAYYSNGKTCSLGCLGCKNPKCMKLDHVDIMCDEVVNFPNDHSLNACPVDAISWDNKYDTPIINSEKCINCGICIRRCPVGAIYFDGIVKVNRTISPCQTQHAADNKIAVIQSQQIEMLDKIGKSGTTIMESDNLFDSIYEKLLAVTSGSHNIIARNLLISLGCKSAIRRIGDVYTRMDAIYTSVDECFGAVEVEFGRETLDASRGILDDIAVLYTRYGIDKDENMPLVICLQLPNARQGYWQVVKDVKNVEDITISTITIGALMLLNWNGCLLMPDDVTYYLDYDNMDLRSTIAWHINRKIKVSNKHLGIFEPMK